jgi:CheY-like chemotaxis protein
MEKKEILIVDDDIIAQNMLKATLANAGYSVLIASNGEEALEKAKKYHPSVIILDIMMPGIDGGEVANLLRNDPQTEKIPIIFLSTLISESEERAGTRSGSTSFFSKPFSRDKLLNEIGRYLRRQNSN